MNMNMFTDPAGHAARQSPVQRTETGQLLLGSMKRSADANNSYMSLMLERQAPKRMKTNTGDVSTDIYSRYLKQQADIRANSMKHHATSLTQFHTVDNRGAPSLSHSFLMDRMTRQTNPGTSSVFQGLNDPAFSMGAHGLTHLMPGLSNSDMSSAFGGQMASLGGNNNGLMLDSSVSARQRLAWNGMNSGTGLSSFSMPSRENQLLLEAASLNNFQSARSTHRNSLLGLSQSDQAFLRGLGMETPSSLSNPMMTASSAPGMGASQFCARVGGGNASLLPMVLARPNEDNRKLSEMQVFLREQIEVFEASQDDTTTHTRGRNKPIRLGQVGIRCRHCAHLPVVQRQKGSTYFPASLLGLYQAAQNMSTCHMQSGLCREMPEDVKAKFANFQNNKVTSSGAGRPYWAHSAKKLGLVDTPEDGIRFIGSMAAHP